ncbi:SEC-C metal-binding domain-containing protein, partial [Rhodobacter capsulatus]|uniref:SEC-C metal-binding domain-containing protein n=1 Tax=Rhodobacter capsulatus TaxID=1061 RepID=UPI001BAF49F6
LAAMQLRPEAWGKIAASRNVRAIKALKKIEELGKLAARFADGGLYKANKLATEAPALIPDLVEELNLFTKAQVPGLPTGFPMAANMASAPGPKVGRNDPCPCGSGKKFKKCCGAGGPVL